MKKTFLASFLSLIIFFAIGVVVVFSAQGNPPTGGGNPPVGGGNPPAGSGNPTTGLNVNLQNPFKSGTDSLFSLMKAVVNNIILPVGGVLTVLAFIYSGFLYVMAQGNESKLATAHKSLLYTSIGTAILLGSWVLANLICQTIGQLGGPICPP